MEAEELLMISGSMILSRPRRPEGEGATAFAIWAVRHEQWCACVDALWGSLLVFGRAEESERERFMQLCGRVEE